jgi:hypothetical protein
MFNFKNDAPLIVVAIILKLEPFFLVAFTFFTLVNIVKVTKIKSIWPVKIPRYKTAAFPIIFQCRR